MAKIEMRLTTETKAPEAKTVSTAKAPIEPLSTRSAQTETDDFEQWKAKRNKERGFNR